MEFTVSTLSSTFENFSRALARRKLSLQKHTERDVWANIVLGRNYSAAASFARDNTKVRAVPITIEQICKILKIRSREVDQMTALSIFAEAIKSDLGELSDSLYELCTLVQSKKGTCLMAAPQGDEYGFGIMDSEFAGYLGIAKLRGFVLSEAERAWYRSSSNIVTGVVNSIVDVDSASVFYANLRLVSKKEDEIFSSFFSGRTGVISLKIAEKLLIEYPGSEMPDWNVSFDKIYDIVCEVFDQSISESNTSWLKIDCDLAEATIDHTVVRLLDAMKWMTLSEKEDQGIDLLVSLAHSAKLPMERILKIS